MGIAGRTPFTEDDFINGELKPGIPKPELGTEVRPGDIKYVDMNDDGVITEADEGYIGGTKDPRMVYGFGGNLNYKQWDFSFFFQGSADAYRVIGGSDYFIPGADKAYWVMYTIIIPIAGQKESFAGCVLASSIREYEYQ